MSVNFANWLGGAVSPINDAIRAGQALRRISDKPTNVTFITPAGIVLAAQMVRIEWDSAASEAESAAGRGPVRKLTIFGVKGHPTIADTDIEKGYRFVYQSQEYRVIDVIDSIGERQGYAEATG